MQWRQLLSCDWSWHSHWGLIPRKFDLKINRSTKNASGTLSRTGFPRAVLFGERLGMKVEFAIIYSFLFSPESNVNDKLQEYKANYIFIICITCSRLVSRTMRARKPSNNLMKKVRNSFIISCILWRIIRVYTEVSLQYETISFYLDFLKITHCHSRITIFYVMGMVGHMTTWLLQKQNSIVKHVEDECPS